MRIFGILLTLFLMQSCSKTEKQMPSCESCNFTCIENLNAEVFTNNCKENWTCQYKVLSQSSIDLTNFYGLGKGDKNVFQMINSTEGSPNIADDEFEYVLVFELDETQNSFSVDGSNLNDLKVHFRRICYCPEVQFMQVYSGCLQGERKSDGSWAIQGNIKVPYTFMLFNTSFDATFR